MTNKKEKTLTQHLGTATAYSLTSAGFAGFVVYLLNKYLNISFDNQELTFLIPVITYISNLLIVIYKKKVMPSLQEWLKN